MGTRRKARELALQFLFEQDFQETPATGVEDRFQFFLDNFEANDKATDYARELVLGVTAHREAIDALIASGSRNWRVERMPGVDRNLLRIAVYEFRHADVPFKVAINEALEIAKRFSTDESASFINGILDMLQER